MLRLTIQLTERVCFSLTACRELMLGFDSCQTAAGQVSVFTIADMLIFKMGRWIRIRMPRTHHSASSIHGEPQETWDATWAGKSRSLWKVSSSQQKQKHLCLVTYTLKDSRVSGWEQTAHCVVQQRKIRSYWQGKKSKHKMLRWLWSFYIQHNIMKAHHSSDYRDYRGTHNKILLMFTVHEAICTE